MKLRIGLCIIPLLLCLTACGESTKTDYALGTVVSISIYEGGNEKDAEEAIKVIHDLEKILSRNISGSEVDRINKAGDGGTEVSEETLELIKKGIYYGDLSDGMFDITIGKVSRMWGFGKNEAVPDKAELESARAATNYKNIKISGNTVSVSSGAELDLGGIAKGYVADKVAEHLKGRGVKSAIINLGGNVLVIGNKGGKPFTVGIQSPFDKGGTICEIEVSDKSVVTSGIYERWFEQNGKRYHHLLNPKTGYPENNTLASVTVIADSSADADALATVLYLAGEDGIAVAEKMENTEAIFVLRDGSIKATSGVEYKTEE